MSSENTASLSQKMSALDAEINSLVASMQKRNRTALIISLVILIAAAIYLTYGYKRYGGEVTPNLVAANAKVQIEQYLPEAADALEKRLIATAPAAVESAELQLRALPEQMAAQLNAETTHQIEKVQPEVEENLYQGLLRAMTDAKARVDTTPGRTDQQRFEALLKEMAVVYGKETAKFINKVHQTYSTQAMFIVNYIDLLAQDHGLDKAQQLQRDMLRNFFILARKYDAQSGKVNHLSTTSLTQPAK